MALDASQLISATIASVAGFVHAETNVNENITCIRLIHEHLTEIMLDQFCDLSHFDLDAVEAGRKPMLDDCSFNCHFGLVVNNCLS